MKDMTKAVDPVVFNEEVYRKLAEELNGLDSADCIYSRLKLCYDAGHYVGKYLAEDKDD